MEPVNVCRLLYNVNTSETMKHSIDEKKRTVVVVWLLVMSTSKGRTTKDEGEVVKMEFCKENRLAKILHVVLLPKKSSL